MLFCIAFSIGGARIIDKTRVCTDTVITCLVVLTVCVLLTAHRETSYVRITLETHLTSTHWTVVNDLTIGIRTAVTGNTAHAINTCLFYWTFRVSTTLWCNLELNQLAVSCFSYDIALWTYTYHCPYRDRIHHITQ